MYAFEQYGFPKEKEMLLFTEDSLGRIAREELKGIEIEKLKEKNKGIKGILNKLFKKHKEEKSDIEEIYSTIDDYVDFTHEMLKDIHGIDFPDEVIMPMKKYLKNHLKSKVALFLNFAKDCGDLEVISKTLKDKLKEYVDKIKINKERIVEKLKQSSESNRKDQVSGISNLLKALYCGIDLAIVDGNSDLGLLYSVSVIYPNSKYYHTNKIITEINEAFDKQIKLIEESV